MMRPETALAECLSRIYTAARAGRAVTAYRSNQFTTDPSVPYTLAGLRAMLTGGGHNQLRDTQFMLSRFSSHEPPPSYCSWPSWNSY